MPGIARPVDAAMAEERPAKNHVRGIWVEEVRQQKAMSPPGRLYYLTLAGASGLDIRRLIEEKVIATTESGAIADTDNRRVIAVEKDSPAVLEIQRRFPGLKILEGDIFEELRGASPIKYPEGERRRYFQATVINLDLTRPLIYDSERENFPQLEAVVKLGELHRPAAYIDWRLFLTLQGRMPEDPDAQQTAQSFLAEYSNAHADLAACVSKLLGEEVYAELRAGRHVDLTVLSIENQQNFVMLFVPMFLIGKLTPQGWLTEVVHSIRYGGEPGVAPIVTWVIRFRHDTRTAGFPLTVTNESLTALSTSCAYIDAEGTFIKLNLCQRFNSPVAQLVAAGFRERSLRSRVTRDKLIEALGPAATQTTRRG